MNIEYILEKGPDYLRQLYSKELDGLGSIENINWLSLAEGASIRAEQALNRGQNNLGKCWADISVKLYEMLSDKSESRNSQLSLYLAAIRMRIKAIQYLGCSSEDQLLDPEIIVNWFFANIERSIDETSEKTKKWTSLSKEEIRELRNLKNILNAMELLINIDCPLAKKQEIKRWLSVKSALP